MLIQAFLSSTPASNLFCTTTPTPTPHPHKPEESSGSLKKPNIQWWAWCRRPDTCAGSPASSTACSVVLVLNYSDLSQAVLPFCGTTFGGWERATPTQNLLWAPRILPELPRHKDWKPRRLSLAAPATVKLCQPFLSRDNSPLVSQSDPLIPGCPVPHLLLQHQSWGWGDSWPPRLVNNIYCELRCDGGFIHTTHWSSVLYCDGVLLSFQQLRKLMLGGCIICPNSQLLSDRVLFCFESQFL